MVTLMTMNRRTLLTCSAALVASTTGSRALDGGRLGLKPGASQDQSVTLSKALARAAAAGEALRLGPGVYRINGVELPDGTRLTGEAGATRLVCDGDRPALVAQRGKSISIENLAVEGNRRARGRDIGLIVAEDVANLTLSRLKLSNAPADGVRLERCGGRLRDLDVSDVGNTAIFSLDASGLMIEGCRISDAGNNGILVWRSAGGWDGTIVRGNRVERIGAASGGTGEYGNAVNVFRAGGVIISDTQAADCAYTAVRANAASDVAIRGTVARNMGEVANNVVEHAAAGISITNFDHGGRLATVQGNLVRDLFKRPHPETGQPTYGYGISGEADTVIIGNVVEKAEDIGINLGWGRYLRDVTASGNLVRGAGVGIGVSVAPGAGRASIIGNTISGAARGAIVGFAWEKAQTGDLSKAGAEINPRLTITSNSVSD
jgi:uncharacterized secreted repeat protein (TIGR03808 family)